MSMARTCPSSRCSKGWKWIEGKLEALDAALSLDVDVRVCSSARCTQRATILCYSIHAVKHSHALTGGGDDPRAEEKKLARGVGII